MSTDTLEHIDLDQEVKTSNFDNDGSHDKFSHYVKKDLQMKALTEGIPVPALCGKTWVPGEFMVGEEAHQICPDCHLIYETIVGTNLPE